MDEHDLYMQVANESGNHPADSNAITRAGSRGSVSSQIGKGIFNRQNSQKKQKLQKALNGLQDKDSFDTTYGHQTTSTNVKGKENTKQMTKVEMFDRIDSVSSNRNSNLGGEMKSVQSIVIDNDDFENIESQINKSLGNLNKFMPILSKKNTMLAMPFEKIEEQAREESPVKSQRTKEEKLMA